MNTDMDSPGLFAADGHPDENQLLLALEKELSPDEAARVEQHLGQCWSCRARFDEMERGILSFVEYRERRSQLPQAA
jgi:predicted anti-sigma-YlaC factor YlaD